MTRWFRPCAAASLTLLTVVPTAAFAQVQPGAELLERQRVTREVFGASQAAVQPPTGLDQRRAEDLRNEFRELMRQFPPALSQVLRLDSSLMNNPDYLSAYPTLAAFLEAHPEVARYPDYFLNFISAGTWQEPLDAESRARIEAVRSQERMLQSLTLTAVGAAIVIGVLWLARLFVAHRRWLRAMRIQSELNNRLLERFGTNEQLLAYLQSQSAQQLTAAPVVTDDTMAATAPFARILWAVQAGLVLTSAGIGLLVIKRYFLAESGLVLLTLGVLAISLGAGFALASYASYILSQRFGLLDDRRSDSRPTSGA
jgi:hypothetical protein